MDKFSLYDFMSFFLPGVLAAFVGYQVIPEGVVVFKSLNELTDGLLFLMVALTLGLGIHRLTFGLLHLKWYKKWLYPSIATLVSDKYPDVSKKFNELNERFNQQKRSPDDLFDEAYYYLEYHDKITTAKAFQSMYFFLRNVFTIALVLLPLVLLLTLWGEFFFDWTHGFYYTLGVLALLFGLPNITVFYRLKMVERVFFSYYVALAHAENKK